MTIFFCSNHEILAGQLEIEEALLDDGSIVADAFDQASKVAGPEVECDYSRRYADWNGGRHDQLHQCYGLVAATRDVPRDLLERIGDAYEVALLND